MDSSSMKSIFDAWVQLQPMRDASSATTFDEALLDLRDPPASGVRGVDAQVPEDVVVLGIRVLQILIEGFGNLFAARDKSGLVGVDLQASCLHMSFERSECHDSFPSHIRGISAFDVKGDVIHPCLKLNGRVILNQSSKRLVKHQLGNCGSLRAALEDALLIVLGLTRDAFSLKKPWPGIEIECQLEVKWRVVQVHGRLNDVVQGDGVVEASEVC